MNTRQIILALTVIALTGCAHSMMRGSVAMKISDNEAHVCLGNDEVKVGDKVDLIRNQCVNSGKRGDGNSCKMITLGEGEVTEVLNEHYSVVKVNPGVKFEEGTLVQKRK